MEITAREIPRKGNLKKKVRREFSSSGIHPVTKTHDCKLIYELITSPIRVVYFPSRRLLNGTQHTGVFWEYNTRASLGLCYPCFQLNITALINIQHNEANYLSFKNEIGVICKGGRLFFHSHKPIRLYKTQPTVTFILYLQIRFYWVYVVRIVTLTINY